MEILRRGFELLRTRPINEHIDINSLEREHEITMPPLFKQFILIFELQFIQAYDEINSGQIISHIEFIDEQYDDNIYIDQLFPIEFCMSSYYENDFWAEKGYMQIASGNSEGGILICIEGEKKDSIILNDGHKYHTLTKNIYEFVRGLVSIKKAEKKLENNIKYSQLYKNWGEGFWRVRK